MGLMGKGPAEWSQSLPNRKVNDVSISTTFKRILNWYGQITTSSSITPTVWKTEFSNGRTVIVFLFISPCPSPGAFTLLNVQTFKPLPLSITTAGTIWARQDTKIESGCVWVVLSAGISSSEKWITLGAMICPTKSASLSRVRLSFTWAFCGTSIICSR